MKKISPGKILLLARGPDQYALEVSAGIPLVKLNPLNFRRTLPPLTLVTHSSLNGYFFKNLFHLGQAE